MALQQTGSKASDEPRHWKPERFPGLYVLIGEPLINDSDKNLSQSDRCEPSSPIPDIVSYDPITGREARFIWPPIGDWPAYVKESGEQ